MELYHTCLGTLAIESIFNDNAGHGDFHVGIIRTEALRVQEHIVSMRQRPGSKQTQRGGENCPVVGLLPIYSQAHHFQYLISM